MRKMQKNLLENAEKKHFSEEQMAVLSDEAFTIAELRRAFRYFDCQRQYYTDDETADEFKRCVQILRPALAVNFCANSIAIMDFLFPLRRDYLLGPEKKKEILELLIQTENASFADGLLRLMLDVPELCQNYKLAGGKAIFPSLVRDGYVIGDAKEASLLWLPVWTSYLGRILKEHPDVDFDEFLENMDVSDADGEGYRKISLNDKKIFESEMRKNPYTEKLKEAGFLDEGDITDENREDSFIGTIQYSKKQFDSSTAERFMQIAPEAEFRLAETYYDVNITADARNRSICMIFSVYQGVSGQNGQISPYGRMSSFKLLLFGNGKAYEELRLKNGRRLIPLTLKTLGQKMERENNPFFWDAWAAIMAVKSQINPFMKDIVRDMGEKTRQLRMPPVSLDKMLEYHSRSDFMTGYYKKAKDICVNWNKRNLAASYLLLQCKSRVDDKSFRKLLQVTDQELMKLAQEAHSADSCLRKVISGYISQTVQASEEEGIEIRDYVNMCMETKEKISLRFQSMKKLKEAHNKVTERHYIKGTRKVTVPKGSKFLTLRRKLPQEFEWIKSRQRLIEETAMQHHCVWSYADRITKDQTAIYSFLDKSGRFSNGKEDTRYTLEFGLDKKGRYFIRQIQGKYNQGNTSELYEHVKNLLV